MLFFLVGGQILAGSVVSQEKEKTHLRWNLSVLKEDIIIYKTDDGAVLKSGNKELITKLGGELGELALQKEYIEHISEVKKDSGGRFWSIEVKTANDSVRLFSFYRNDDKKIYC